MTMDYRGVEPGLLPDYASKENRKVNVATQFQVAFKTLRKGGSKYIYMYSEMENLLRTLGRENVEIR